MNSNVKSIVLDGAECIRFTIKNDTYMYLHVVGNYFRNKTSEYFGKMSVPQNNILRLMSEIPEPHCAIWGGGGI